MLTNDRNFAHIAAVLLLTLAAMAIPAISTHADPPASQPAAAPAEPIKNSIGMSLVRISAGTFTMGSPKGEKDRRDNEDQHEVVIAKPFYMARTTVTQAQWKAVMGTEPSNFMGDNLPVEQVSWNDAQAYCKKLSEKEGKKYRLPTEAEWEYACRSGTTGPYGGTGKLDEMGWHGGNSDSKTHPVGQKKPNAWGLYDMHGNVRQWCQDKYDDQYRSYRILRGGSWCNGPYDCRSASRDWEPPDFRDSDGIGFRVVLDLSE